MTNRHEKEARESYLEAIGVEADCCEALYNLGLVSKLMGEYEGATQVFKKLNQLIPRSPEVVYELSDCAERMGDLPLAIEWIHRLINIVPSDPSVWRRLGAIWDKDGNETQAFHCYSESFKFCPSDIDVIVWLGSYFRTHQHYDNALKFFERAAAIAPKETRYSLMVASCYRNMDCRQEALEVYERVFRQDPTNKAALEHLIKLTNEMGLGQKTAHYQAALQDLKERLAEMHEQQKGTKGGPDIFQPKQGNAMTGATLAQNPMLFTKEKAMDAPSLRVGGGKDMVQTGVAGGKEDGDIWDDMKELDLGGDK
jgi:intraflagellar transport protein 88